MDDLLAQQLFGGMSNILWFQGVLALIVMFGIGVRLLVETLTPADERMPVWRRLCLVFAAAMPYTAALRGFQAHLRAIGRRSILSFTVDYLSSGYLEFAIMLLFCLVLSSVVILTWKPEKKSCCATGCGCK